MRDWHEFQSALHPKVKGISLTQKLFNQIQEFQSALHPKVKGSSPRFIGRCCSISVSIRPSPKGEGNHLLVMRRTQATHVSIRPSPKGEGNQVEKSSIYYAFGFQSALHPKVKGISGLSRLTMVRLCFNPPFTQR